MEIIFLWSALVATGEREWTGRESVWEMTKHILNFPALSPLFAFFLLLLYRLFYSVVAEGAYVLG